VNNNACEPLVKTEFFWDYDTQDWANHALDSFFYALDYNKQIHYNWSGFDQEWVLAYSETSGTSEPRWREYMSFNPQGGGNLNRQEYDENGNTVYAVSKYKASDIQEWNFEYEESNSYNMDNQLLQSTRKEIYIDSLDTWERVVDIKHYYNDQGYIEETETSITILEPDQTINQIDYSWVNEYSFYCNDLRKERIEYLDSEYHWRYKYGYKKTADCRDIIESELIVYPNPATDFILIQAPEFEDSDYMIDIYNSQGQVVFTKAFQNNSSFHHLDISPLNTGIYFISIISNNGNEISSAWIFKN
ncbi:MAG: T9SS type A sorting domain-containing protein, partial [Bacteroidia bacterium]|nr:T9SS type A sorting domain-containing protein [Bacteroidia bacterium]